MALSTIDTSSISGLGYGFKNRIINGAMVIDQRNAGASVTPTTNGTYVTDRFGFNLSQASKFSAQQSTTAPAGFKNSLLVTSLSSYSVGVNDYFLVRQTIEGNNIADLNWGSANAATVTLSFWVRSSLTGTFGGALENSDSTRCYPFSYTISSANTWEQKTITIAGDTSGTWLTDTGRGVKVTFSLGMGSNLSGTANAWVGSEKISVTGATSVVGANGATFYITGVQLEKGTVATSFDYRPYGTELALCQRYYEKSYPLNITPATANIYDGMAGGDMPAGQYARFRAFFRVSKRTQPSVVLYAYNGTINATTSGGGTTNTNPSANFIGDGSFGVVGVSAPLASTTEVFAHWTASAEL